MRDRLKELLDERVKKYVSHNTLRIEDTKIQNKLMSLKERSGEIVNVKARGMIKSFNCEKGFASILYDIHWKYLIKQKELMYIEEEIEHRQALAQDELLIEDNELPIRYLDESVEWEGESGERIPYVYNRLKAVQYAERWWNEFNPAYKRFGNDCTSFISQCLRAGGAPMWGSPNRSKGWWYSGRSWSYSWSVAHALKLYLQSSSIGIRTRKVARPEHLKLGDIICYDFEGDGRFNHNTIVTGKDAYGMPLVNAHTTNSRLRYWKYEDSTAYTPKIKYVFYTIIDEH